MEMNYIQNSVPAVGINAFDTDGASSSATAATAMFDAADGLVNRKRDNTSSNNAAAAAAITDNNDTSTNNGTPAKATRINWSKSPHRERLSQILHDWFSRTGLALDATTHQPITDYRIYADKVGISYMTLFKYIRADPSKRRIINEGVGRGKKRLIDEEGINSIVTQLKAKVDV